MLSRPLSRFGRAIALAGLLTVAAFPSASMATPPAGNVVSNPGFEAICAGNVPCNWQRAAGDESTFTSSTDAHSGAASLEVVGNTARGAESDCVTGISPGDVISLSYWIKGLSGPLTNGYGVARYYSDSNCATSIGNYVLSGFSAVQINQWVQTQPGGAAGPGGGTAPAGTHSVRLQAIMGCSGPCSALFDDVSATAQAAAVPCAAGSYSTTGDEPCTAAPAGSYVGTAGASSATPCSAGTYQDLTGQISCKPAGLGFYVPTSGAASQTACPVGETTLVTGATSCVVTLGSISAVIRSFFGGDTHGANGLIDKAGAIANATNANTKASALKAFNQQVDVKIGKPLTAVQGAILKQLAARL